MAFTQQMQVSFRPKPPPAPTETLVVHLHANGTKDVAGMPVNDMELDIVFRGALKTDPQPHMVFAPDKGVSQDVAVKLLDRAKAAGLTNVSIATSP
jgi:biopolymer transport protein ExbD